MRMNFAIAGLLVVGMLASVAALASAIEDVSLQYSGDSVAVRNNGTTTVAARVLRTCPTSNALPHLNFPNLRYFKVVAHPSDVVRIDRDRSGACSYAITKAHYVERLETVR